MQEKTTMIKKIKHRYDYMGIKNKTLLQVFVVVIFFMLIFIGMFLFIFTKKIESDNVTYSRQLLQNANKRLENYFDEIASIANEANYNYYLQNYLIAEKDNAEGYSNLTNAKSMQDYEMSSKVFNSSLNSRTDVTSLMIFGKKSLLLHKSIYEFWSVVQEYDSYPWYQKAIETPNTSVITGPMRHEFLKDNTEQTISLSRRISSYEDGSFLGVILIDLNLNKIAEIFESFYANGEGALCILNDQGQIVYPMNYDKVTPQLLEKLNSSAKDNFIARIDQEEYQVVAATFEKADWKVLSITSTGKLKESMYDTLGIVIAAIVLVMVILGVALSRILKGVVNPILRLKGHIDLADEGHLSERAEVLNHNETGALSKSFNKMLDRIENLMGEVVNEQEEKRKYELQALQAQINPHFLYNTLDSIIWMAEAKNSDVVPMTEALAKLFRISLNKGNEFIRIEDEMEHVRNYLVIQSMRYTDKFTYHIEIKDEVRYCKTIKLIVQPIVENSIYHGIKKKRGKGRIDILAYREKEKLCIRIQDDGNGMNEEICRAILTKDSKFENSSGSGIGVKNVNERIQLYFGKEYGLRYTSVLGEGTTAELVLPVIEETIG
ncbi:Sensor histidine kinase YehU [Robinsoniella peoriensis]|uniref:histidine kinase n=2 Tax=Robinsoniella peoriensis TaxID=180332 RepID=A0A4U8Q9D1_9FIRM|nr:Sensor histidine kinase YehU [Robinsoniella peoriensis]